jgi:hypothetical protein
VKAVIGPEALKSPNSHAVCCVVGRDMEKAKTIARSEGLSKLELILIADSLATAASEFSDHSCNDFSFPATPEYKAVGEAIVRHREPGYWSKDNTLADFLSRMAAQKEWVVVYDDWAADYFADRCKRLASVAPVGKLSAAELGIVDELLESSAEDHEGWYSDGGVDLDITLSPSAEHRSLIAAAIEHQAPRGWKAKVAKLEKATGPISLPDFQVMRYLAARCRAHAAVADLVFTAGAPSASPATPAQDAAEMRAGAVPVIQRAGIAPRFPQIKPYLKAYSQSFENWHSEEVPRLEQYAAGKSDATLRHDSNVTLGFIYARQSLFRCSLALRWHAMQMALGGATATGKEKNAKVPNLKATERDFEKLVEGGQHVHMQIPPALNARDFKKALEPEFEGRYAEQIDAEVSRAEFDIVRHLLFKGHAPEHVQHAFLALAPELAARKGNDAATYVADTMQRAVADPKLQKWREDQRSAQADATALQRAVGKDWQALRRRSVAYDYWSCRMAAHSGGPYDYWLDNIVGTATDCLVLGWEKESVSLFQQVREHLKQNRFSGSLNDKKHATQYLLLRLVFDWQGWPRQSDGEPLFAALLAHWRTPDADALAPLLLAVCDRHTHQAVKNDADSGATYYPFETLAVLRLRVLHGLKNPPLDHTLISTPLGALPEATEPYTDELLENVLKQARLEFQDL